MSSLIYVSVNGSMQGNLSEGCCSMNSIGNKGQVSHVDQILVSGMNHSMARERNIAHHPLTIQKFIDKSSPLLSMALANNEVLQVDIFIYRVNQMGMQELYYTIKLKDASIADIGIVFPHSVSQNHADPYEMVSFKYKSIAWSHVVAGTSGYCIWDESVY